MYFQSLVDLNQTVDTYDQIIHFSNSRTNSNASFIISCLGQTLRFKFQTPRENFKLEVKGDITNNSM